MFSQLGMTILDHLCVPLVVKLKPLHLVNLNIFEEQAKTSVMRPPKKRAIFKPPSIMTGLDPFP